MKRITLTILVSFVTVAIFAQAPAKKSVILDYFGRTEFVPQAYCDLIRSNVLTALTNSGRLNLIDAANVVE